MSPERRAGRRAAAACRGVLLLAGTVPVVACSSVGNGSGDVQGALQVPACTFHEDATPIPLKDGDPFYFRPTFFVGQPIDADPILAPRFPANQMVVRVQPEAKRLEDADVLIFWIFDSAAVARCIRGATPGGVPEWDPVVCDRSAAAPNEPGRMFVGMTSEGVASFLSLSHSCPKGLVTANALGACTDGSCPDVALCPGRGSWITFSNFGKLPSDASQAIPAGYKVSDGDTIEATDFHLELCDGATVNATLDHVLPVPEPNIVGTLNGNFRFDLVRGQGGQPFP